MSSDNSNGKTPNKRTLWSWGPRHRVLFASSFQKGFSQFDRLLQCDLSILDAMLFPWFTLTATLMLLMQGKTSKAPIWLWNRQVVLKFCTATPPSPWWVTMFSPTPQSIMRSYGGCFQVVPGPGPTPWVFLDSKMDSLWKWPGSNFQFASRSLPQGILVPKKANGVRSEQWGGGWLEEVGVQRTQPSR